jgi:hypothetical protein
VNRPRSLLSLQRYHLQDRTSIAPSSHARPLTGAYNDRYRELTNNPTVLP